MKNNFHLNTILSINSLRKAQYCDNHLSLPCHLLHASDHPPSFHPAACLADKLSCTYSLSLRHHHIYHRPVINYTTRIVIIIFFDTTIDEIAIFILSSSAEASSDVLL